MTVVITTIIKILSLSSINATKPFAEPKQYAKQTSTGRRQTTMINSESISKRKRPIKRMMGKKMNSRRKSMIIRHCSRRKTSRT